jgi:hypothetical protein
MLELERSQDSEQFVVVRKVHLFSCAYQAHGSHVNPHPPPHTHTDSGHCFSKTHRPDFELIFEKFPRPLHQIAKIFQNFA